MKKVIQTYLALILTISGLMPLCAHAQIIMPDTGDTTIVIPSSSSQTVLDPGGYSNYPVSNSTMTIKSSDGHPFSLTGSYIKHPQYLHIHY